MSRFPWGAGPAPALRCDECGKRIGIRRGHHVLSDGEILLCGGCRTSYSAGRGRGMHSKYYPDCPDSWHDMFDHPGHLATRAAAWFVLSDPAKRLCS